MKESNNPKKLAREQKLREEQLAHEKAVRRSKIITAIAVPVAVILIALLIFMNTGAFRRTVTAATVNGEKISAAEMNYYYAITFNSLYNDLVDTYGETLAGYFVDTSSSLKTQQYSDDMTWHEYVLEAALNNIRSIKGLCAAGEAEGFEMTEEAKESVEAQVEAIETYAESAGVSTGRYLSVSYGEGVNMKVFSECVEETTYAALYADTKEGEISVTREEMDAEYNADTTAYDQVTFRYFPITIEEDDTDGAAALAEANEMMEAVAAAADADKDNTFVIEAQKKDESYADPDYSLAEGRLKSSLSTEYSDWLYDDARQEYDLTVIKGETYVYLLMFKERFSPEYNMRSFRHILITPEDTENEASWDEAEAEAQALLDEWMAGDATEDSFAELANDNSTDTGSNTTGGLYEDVTVGQMVNSVNDWVFDDARAAGDTALVRSDYGWHVMYYVGETGSYYEYVLGETIAADRYDEWETAQLEGWEIQQKSFGMRYVG